jgi:parallel beta-helix repeat protein
MKTKTFHHAILLAVLLIGAVALTLKPAGASSGTGTIAVPDDYPRIQDAIDAANLGDTIIVRAGTYNEEYVTLDKPVYLFGENQKSVIVYHSSLGFAITASDVHLAGFTIKSVESGQGHAVDLADSRGCVIEDNLVEDNLVGISVYGASSGNTVSGNVLRNNERSIELIDASDNIISDNNITGALVSGISLDVSSGNTVSGNSISDLVDGMGALMLWKSSNNVISRNLLFGGNPMLMIECTSNTLSENFVMDNEYGIVVGDSSGNSIYSNYFINVTQQVLDTELGAGMPSENRWDNGKEGNYWSNYAGTDADDDGLGDSPYVLYEDNQDNYPLMDYPSSSSFVATGRPEPTESSSAALPLPTEVLIGIIVAAVVIAAVAMIKLRKN